MRLLRQPILNWLKTLIFALFIAPSLLLAQVEEQAGNALEEKQIHWETLVEQAQALKTDDSEDLDQIDLLRSRLSEALGDIRQEITAVSRDLARLETQFDSLAPAGDEAGEQENLRQRRNELNSAIGTLQVTMLDLDGNLERMTEAVRYADAVARGVLANRLIERMPSPLNPENWVLAVETARDGAGRWMVSLYEKLTNPENGISFYANILPGFVSFVFGLVLLFGVKFRFGKIVEFAYRRSGQTHSNVWVWIVVNAFWLGLLAISAAFILIGMNLSGLFEAAGPDQFKALTMVLATLAIFYWISLNVFFPELPEFRLLSFDDASARKGRRYFRLLGVATAISVYLGALSQQGLLSATVLSIATFLVVLPTGVLLLRLLRLYATLDPADESEASEGDDGNLSHSDQLAPRVQRWFGRFVTLNAILAPACALIGYSNAAAFLLEGTAFTLALLATSYILYRLILALVFYARRLRKFSDADASKDVGLISVAIGSVITLAAVPFLTLIWGAQRSDLQSVWFRMRDGVAFGDTRVSLTDIVLFFIVFGVGYLLTRSVQAFVKGTVLPRTQLDIGGRNALLSGIRYVGLFLAALFAFSSTGLDLSNLALVAGALSVGIGFGLQTIVSNFVSGIILLIERPIKQGDWIEVAGFAGYVREIKVRSTEIETFDRASVIVPNQELIAGTVLNWTHSSMSGRAIVPIGVAYGTDPRLVEKILIDIAKAHPLVLLKPEPTVIFASFGDSSLNFEIRCFLRDVNYKLSAISDMNFEIAKRFAEEDIEIPFVQRDVNLKNISELGRLVGRPDPQDEA